LHVCDGGIPIQYVKVLLIIQNGSFFTAIQSDEVSNTWTAR